MSTRKIFSSGEKELSYQIDSAGELYLEILMAGNTKAGITLEYDDSIQFISELNKCRKLLKIPVKYIANTKN